MRSESRVDFFDGLAGVLGDNFVQASFGVDDFLGFDLDFRRLSGDAAAGDERLVDHDPGMRQGKALALGSRASESTAPKDIAMPMQIVVMGQRMYCIVS